MPSVVYYGVQDECDAHNKMRKESRQKCVPAKKGKEDHAQKKKKLFQCLINGLNVAGRTIFYSESF